MRHAERARAAARAELRDELLNAAADLLVAGGWKALTMRAVAEQAGVSRQTAYAEIGDKPRLVEALVLRETRRFCDGVEAALGRARSVHAAVREAVAYSLRATAADPLVKAVVHGDDALLPLLTSRGEPVHAAVRERLARTLVERFPGHPPADVRLTSDVVTRLVLSHLVMPLEPVDRVADDVARTAARLLRTAEPRTRRSGP